MNHVRGISPDDDDEQDLNRLSKKMSESVSSRVQYIGPILSFEM
jgi:hypothetical protein